MATVALQNQTESINPTTLFTPSFDGLYVIHVYSTCTTSGGGNAEITLSWTDDATVQTWSPTSLDLSNQGVYTAGSSFLVKCQGGQSLSYSVSLVELTGSPTYSLYIAVVTP